MVGVGGTGTQVSASNLLILQLEENGIFGLKFKTFSHKLTYTKLFHLHHLKKEERRKAWHSTL
jgi:hypothetical protein